MIWESFKLYVPRACSPLLLSSIPSYRCIPASQFSFIYDVEGAMIRVWNGKEFPDMKQNEKEVKFIRVGDADRTVGQLEGELMLSRGP